MIYPTPPPDYTDIGPLSDVAPKLAVHIDGERRRTWDVALPDLGVADDGRVFARGHVPVPLERGGFDALLKSMTACFPRAPTLLSRVSAPLFAQVWRELYDPSADGMPLDVRVYERGGPAGRQVWATSPTSYPSSYHVGKLALDLAERLPGVMTLARYEAADSKLTLTLVFDRYHVVVSVSDRYDEGGASVVVARPDGTVLGDPLPGVKSRRRAAADGQPGNTTVADGIAAKVRAAPAWVVKNLPGNTASL